MPMHTSAVEARGLVKRYGTTTALGGIDLEVPTGTVTAVLGPNGAGKTTAVRILTTLSEADEGRAMVAGFDVRTQATEVRRRIGLASQDATVDPLLTGRENLVMLGELHQLGRREAATRAGELLGDFGLTEAADRVMSGYSGGMRRRLDLAATLVARPQVLFLDEPTTGLDPRARLELWAVLDTLVERGTTIVLTTQYLDEAERLADDIVVVDHGCVIAQGDSRSLKSQVGGDQIHVVVVDPAGPIRRRRRPRPPHRRRTDRRHRHPFDHGPHRAGGGRGGGSGRGAGRRPHRRRRPRPAPTHPRRGVPDPHRIGDGGPRRHRHDPGEDRLMTTTTITTLPAPDRGGP